MSIKVLVPVDAVVGHGRSDALLRWADKGCIKPLQRLVGSMSHLVADLSLQLVDIVDEVIVAVAIVWPRIVVGAKVSVAAIITTTFAALSEATNMRLPRRSMHI